MTAYTIHAYGASDPNHGVDRNVAVVHDYTNATANVAKLYSEEAISTFIAGCMMANHSLWDGDTRRPIVVAETLFHL